MLLNSNCQVAGTPTAVGSSTVSVAATDSSNPAITSTGNVTVTVNPAPVTLTISNPPIATINTPYSGTIPVAGGTAPYLCTLAPGTLPAGLNLANGCTLTGTATAVRTTTVGITATDGVNPTDTSTSPVVITVQRFRRLPFPVRCRMARSTRHTRKRYKRRVESVLTRTRSPLDRFPQA